MNNPLVSIVVPAYNSEKTISLTLNALLDQTYKNIEVIVVDDGSVDNTARLVQAVPSVKYIYQDNRGPATARNTGGKEAKGEFIFFTDSDCLPFPNWIETGLKGFADQKVAVVAGSYGIANEQNRLARLIYKEIIFRHQYLMPEYPKVFGSYNFGIRKKVFKEVGGFNVYYRHASGEDNDLSYKVLLYGHRIYFEKDSKVRHFHPSRLTQYLKEQYRHGFWRVKMYIDFPTMMTGDGYTFWKDILEILFAGSVFFLFPFSFVSARLFGILLAFILCVLLALQVFFAFMVKIKPADVFMFVFVLFLRAFARTVGFISGLIYFFILKNIKKELNP